MKPMEEPWIPDLVITADHPVGRIINVYLNGEKELRVLECRVNTESFERECFGELVVAVTSKEDPMRLTPVSVRKPRLGEFQYDGCWSRLVCGRVRIEITDQAEFDRISPGLLTYNA